MCFPNSHCVFLSTHSPTWSCNIPHRADNPPHTGESHWWNDNVQNQLLRWQRFLPIIFLLKCQRVQDRFAASSSCNYLFIIDHFCVSSSYRCSFCLVGQHLLPRLLHLLFSHFLHLTFIYSPTLYFLTFPMSSPSTPVWHLRKLSYKAQDRRDLIQSIWRALAEVDDIVSQELARVQSTEIVAVIVT